MVFFLLMSKLEDNYNTNVLNCCRIKYLSQPSTVSEQWFDTVRNTSLAFMLKQSQSQECKLWNLVIYHQ